MFSYTLELYPNYGSIHISLFTNVKNSAELRKRLLSHDSELSYAFVDAKVVKIFINIFVLFRYMDIFIHKTNIYFQDTW